MNLHQELTHPQYVEGCFGCKAATLKVAYTGINGSDSTRQKRWDKELDDYRSAVKAGIQPDSTRTRSIRPAVEWSNKTGIPYSDEAKKEYDFNKALERQS